VNSVGIYLVWRNTRSFGFFQEGTGQECGLHLAGYETPATFLLQHLQLHAVLLSRLFSVLKFVPLTKCSVLQTNNVTQLYNVLHGRSHCFNIPQDAHCKQPFFPSTACDAPACSCLNAISVGGEWQVGIGLTISME